VAVPLLDTTVFVDLMRTRSPEKYQPALDALARFTTAEDPVSTTRFTIAELLVGVERCDDPANQQSRVNTVLAGVLIREFGEDAMNIYAKVDANQRKIGRPIGVMDMLIASVALASGQLLLTRNMKHFQDVPGLRLAGYG
jgi:tRNA(fMet)-specific endonuclease VapC